MNIQKAWLRNGGDHRENGEDYRGELFRHGNVRVAVCRDGIKWLLQRRRGRISPGEAVWDTHSYCQTKKALMRLHRAQMGFVAPEIVNLPERTGRACTGQIANASVCQERKQECQ